MYYYKLYGMRIVSDFELEYLMKQSVNEQALAPQIVIEESIVPQEFKLGEECYYKIEKEISIVSNSYCYLLMEHGEKIYYERKEGITSQLLSAYILGWGIAILFHQREQIAIHCSCLAKGGKALLISGNSGSGKSTITSELLENGFDFMADDMSVIRASEDGDMFATAAFPYQKLCRDVAQTTSITREDMIYIDEDKDKFLVPYKGTFVDMPTSIKAMIILKVTKTERVVVQELTGADKFRACMDSLFLCPLLGEQLYIPEHGMRVLKFASRIPVYQIARPIGKNSKQEIVNAVLKLWQST